MRPYKVTIRFGPRELEMLDNKRGKQNRSAFVRKLIEKWSN